MLDSNAATHVPSPILARGSTLAIGSVSFFDPHHLISLPIMPPPPLPFPPPPPPPPPQYCNLSVLREASGWPLASFAYYQVLRQSILHIWPSVCIVELAMSVSAELISQNTQQQQQQNIHYKRSQCNRCALIMMAQLTSDVFCRCQKQTKLA